MTQLLLILLGLFSNPSSANTSNCGSDGTIITTSASQSDPNPGGTGGEDGQTPKK